MKVTITQLKIGLVLIVFGALLLSGRVAYHSYAQYKHSNMMERPCPMLLEVPTKPGSCQAK